MAVDRPCGSNAVAQLTTPRYTSLLRVKLVACARLGRIEEGRELLQQVLALQPGLTIAGLKAYPGMSATPEVTQMVAEGLRRAGLPEE